MNYYIADTHFGHQNIIKLCDRPFDSVEAMNQYLIDGWNRRITDDDDVYILGDFCFKGQPYKTYLHKLKGRKHLIIGNHDTKTLRDPNVDKEFVEVEKYLEIEDNGRWLFLCHYPMLEWPGFYRGTIHLYGHVHNSFHNNRTAMAMKLRGAYNVGADILGFEPMTLDEIIGLYENDIRKDEELI